MSNNPSPSLIGIDGGGTACRFALIHGGQRFEVQRGRANATSDLAGAQATLLGGLADLADAAGLSLARLTHFPSHIGVAGVIDEATAKALASALPLSRMQVEDDRRSALVGALGGSDGFVAAIGTGSFLGRRRGGVERVIGGWGLTLGDAASGAYLGRQLLRCAAEAHDGTAPMTPLTRDILGRFETPAALVRFARDATPGDFATFAPEIVGAAEHDRVARALMEDGARYIERGLMALDWQSGARLCLLGGLAPHYASYLREEFAAELTDAAGTALDGALDLAARM